MKIVLHIGMPKAGSTALQNGLSALRDQLLEQGVLYPTSPVVATRHPLLISGLVSAQRMPRYLRSRYTGRFQEIEQDAQAWLAQLDKARTAHKPATLVLSDESLFRVRGVGGARLLAQRLRSLGGPVEVVAYVRRPSDHFLSTAQQTLKGSDKIQQPQSVSYCETLDAYAKHVADEFRVFPYDRSAWPEGDILRHFLHTCLPGVDVALDSVPPAPNQSMSAEAMSVLADYRKAFWAGAHNQFTPDTWRLIRVLAAADSSVDGSGRPRLHEHIRRFVDHTSTDLLPLRDAYGVTFDGVDYEAIGELSGVAPVARTIEDLCVVDAQRKADLALHALYQLASLTQDQAPP